MQQVSLLTPLAYITVLATLFYFFKKAHQKRERQKFASTKQFYETNVARDVFEFMKASESTTPAVLKAALIAYGVELFTRMLRFRENEPIMTLLLQKGEIGDETFERFSGSKVLNEREMQEVVQHSLKIDPNWSTFMATVTEVTQQNAVRRRLNQNEEFREQYRQMKSTVSVV